MVTTVQFSSVAQSCPTLRNRRDYSTLGLPVHHQLWVYSKSRPLIQWCHPTILSSVTPFSSHLQSFPASGSFESILCIRWPKYWSFSFIISPSSEYSGLISFRTDWIERQLNNGNIYFTIQVIRDQEFVLKLFLRITQEVKADFIGRLEIIKMDTY